MSNKFDQPPAPTWTTGISSGPWECKRLEHMRCAHESCQPTVLTSVAAGHTGMNALRSTPTQMVVNYTRVDPDTGILEASEDGVTWYELALGDVHRATVMYDADE